MDIGSQQTLDRLFGSIDDHLDKIYTRLDALERRVAELTLKVEHERIKDG